MFNVAFLYLKKKSKASSYSLIGEIKVNSMHSLKSVRYLDLVLHKISSICHILPLVPWDFRRTLSFPPSPHCTRILFLTDQMLLLNSKNSSFYFLGSVLSVWQQYIFNGMMHFISDVLQNVCTSQTWRKTWSLAWTVGHLNEKPIKWTRQFFMPASSQ